MNVTLNSDDCCDQQFVNVTLYQGETVSILIKFPFDVTDFLFESTINFPTPIFLTNGVGIEIVDAVHGQITLNLASEQTQDIMPGKYPFDFWGSSGSVPPFNTEEFSGFFNILKTITRIT